MRGRWAMLPLVAALALGACTGDDDDDAGATGDTTAVPAAPVEAAFTMPVMRCEELADPSDSLDWSGIQATEVALFNQSELALQHAWQWPYYLATWGATGREGWFVVGVSGGAVELQAELDQLYPGARVLAMQIPATEGELSDLAAVVGTALAEADVDLEAPIHWSVSRGLVMVPLGRITEQRVSALQPFAGDTGVCVEGEIVNE